MMGSAPAQHEDDGCDCTGINQLSCTGTLRSLGETGMAKRVFIKGGRVGASKKKGCASGTSKRVEKGKEGNDLAHGNLT